MEKSQRRRGRLIVQAALLLGSATVFSSVDAAAAPVTISSTSYTGSGCPTGSAFSLISSDGSQVLLGFDSFQASTGGNSSDLSCQASIGLSVQPGPTAFSVTVKNDGYVRLDPAVIGNVTNTISFAGQTTAPNNTSFINDPNGMTYTVTSTEAFSTNQSAPSTLVLLINERDFLTSPVGLSGTLSIDDLVVTIGAAPVSVPEPTALALLALPMGVAGVLTKRRRQEAA